MYFSYKFNLNEENRLKTFYQIMMLFLNSNNIVSLLQNVPNLKLFYQSGKLVIQGSCVDDVVQALLEEFKIQNVNLNCNSVSNNEKNKKTSDKTTSNHNYSAYIGVDESEKEISLALLSLQVFV
ncbi:MAG: hypothetical protein L6V95_01775 [Candidatus Melainabacteria bacterium]|nr:MAG: hypothetical protein L6V95_01775 [Candidatus Melainabacteria bacterium]